MEVLRMRLIDADACLNEAWQNFYNQEDDHEKNIDGYDIMRDQFYEQSGFECCQQAIVNAPTAEAIPRADYEEQLKNDLAAIVLEIQNEIEEIPRYRMTPDCICVYRQPSEYMSDVNNVIKKVIDGLREESEDKE